MSTSALTVGLLGMIAVCAVTVTVLLLTAFSGLMRVLHQLQEILPVCRKTMEEAQGALHESKQILGRANRVTQEVENVVRKSCRAAAEAVEQLLFFKKKAVSFIENRFEASNGNGARHTPRRHYR